PGTRGELGDPVHDPAVHLRGRADRRRGRRGCLIHPYSWPCVAFLLSTHGQGSTPSPKQERTGEAPCRSLVPLAPRPSSNSSLTSVCSLSTRLRMTNSPTSIALSRRPTG